MKTRKKPEHARPGNSQKTGIIPGGIALGILLPFSSFGTTLAPNFTLEGRLLNAAGTAAATDTVDFTVGVYSPAGTCLLYEQRINNVDLSQTEGFYRLTVGTNTGSASRTSSDPGKTIAAIFSNSSQIRADDTATTQTCPGGYTPAAGDTRMVRITVTPQSTGVPETLSPDLSISPVPHATVAESVQGLTPELLLQITGNSTPYVFNSSDIDKLFGPLGPGATAAADASTMHHHDSLYAKLGGSNSLSLNSGAYLGLGSRASDPVGLTAADAGKTWYDSTENSVKFFDGTAVRTLGSSSAPASSTNTNDAIVKRDSSGNFSAGTITAAGMTLPPMPGYPSNPTDAATKAYVDSVAGGGGQWTTSGSDIYRSSGNVGIGTNSPGAKLSVVSTGGSSPASYVMQVSQSSTTGDVTDSNSLLSFTHTNGANGREWRVGIGSNTYFGHPDNFGIMDMLGTSNPFVIKAGTGSVGIGTKTPVSKLDVNGGASIGSYAGTNAAPSNGLIVSGNVGIGTTAPSAILDILGSAATGSNSAATALKIVGGAGGPTGGNGGGVSITGGTATPYMGGTGGSLSLTAGAGHLAGGSVSLTGGTSSPSGGYGGTISLSGGQGTGTAGNVTITAGNGGNGSSPGGTVNITGGNGATSGTTQNGGPINITAGAGSTGGNGANVVINGGAKNGAGSDGNVIIANTRGKVGIGTISPNATLQVNGTLTGKPAVDNANATIDFSTGNLQYTTSDCGAFQFNNMKDGGSYTFIVQGTNSATCSFTAYSDAGSTALTVHLPPDIAATTAGKHTIFNMIVAGAHVYVAWTPGY